MKEFTLTELINAVHGELLQGGAERFSAVSTDSREISDGALFLPIVGETFDGHDFIDKALAAGAAGCLCARVPETLLPGKFYVKVADTTLAYKDLAAWYRAQFDLPVVQRMAFERNYFELVVFLEEHPKEYVRFILYGEA